MDKERAIREVHEIKQVMEETRNRSDRGKYWIVPGLALLAMLISGLFPFLAPVIAICLIVGGVIIWRRNNEQIMKAIAVGIIAVGIVILLVTLFVILGLVAYSTSGIMESSQTVVPHHN